MTKHMHKHLTAFQFVQRWFLGILALRSIFLALVGFSSELWLHATTADLAVAHTDTQTCKVQSKSTLALTSKEPLPTPFHQPNFSSLNYLFSKNEAQPYQRGTAITTIFRGSKKGGWGLTAPSDHSPVRGRVIKERARRKGHGEVGGKWGEGEVGRGERRGREGHRARETRAREEETGRQEGNGPGHSAHPLMERRRARAIRRAERRGRAPETPPHRQGPITLLLSLSPASARPGHCHSPGPPQRERRRRRPRDPGAGRDGTDRARPRPPRGSRETQSRPPRGAGNHSAPSLPPPSASQ